MLRRVCASYLWVAPIVFIPLAALYHAVGFSAGLAGGVVHLAMTVIGLHTVGAFLHQEDESSSSLGVALLIIGGAAVWATGPSGPPSPDKLAVAAFNQIGLTLGFLLTLLGLAALAPAVASRRERAVASLGFTCFGLMFVFWVIVQSLGAAVVRSPLIALAPAQRPEGFQIMRDFGAIVFAMAAIGGYLGGAAAAVVALRAGWVGRGTGKLMVIYCVLGAVALPASQFMLRSAGGSASDVPRAAWLLLPYLPPAMMCLVPYYVGVLGLAQWAKSQPAPITGQAASFSRSL